MSRIMSSLNIGRVRLSRRARLNRRPDRTVFLGALLTCRFYRNSIDMLLAGFGATPQ